jgi:hypothetical protein
MFVCHEIKTGTTLDLNDKRIGNAGTQMLTDVLPHSTVRSLLYSSIVFVVASL